MLLIVQQRNFTMWKHLLEIEKLEDALVFYCNPVTRRCYFKNRGKQ